MKCLRPTGLVKGQQGLKKARNHKIWTTKSHLAALLLLQLATKFSAKSMCVVRCALRTAHCAVTALQCVKLNRYIYITEQLI